MHDIINAKYIEDYKLHLFFDNGVDGILDFKEYINKRGLFSKFQDINFFKNFFINKDIGTICWADNLDIAPETLYYKLTNEQMPEWVEV